VLERVRDLACALLIGLALACGGGESQTPPGDAPSAAPSGATSSPDDVQPAAAAEAPKAAHERERSERPLPAFSGWTLDGEHLEISSLIGKRLVIWFFNP
jgi:hypothetical protein